MPTPLQKEINFIRTLRRRFTHVEEYINVIDDMVTSGMVSKRAADKVLSNKKEVAPKKKVDPPIDCKPAYEGCSGRRSYC